MTNTVYVIFADLFSGTFMYMYVYVRVCAHVCRYIFGIVAAKCYCSSMTVSTFSIVLCRESSQRLTTKTNMLQDTNKVLNSPVTSSPTSACVGSQHSNNEHDRTRQRCSCVVHLRRCLVARLVSGCSTRRLTGEYFSY